MSTYNVPGSVLDEDVEEVDKDVEEADEVDVAEIVVEVTVVPEHTGAVQAPPALEGAT